MATKSAKKATQRKSSAKTPLENKEISKLIIQDVIFGCETMGIDAEVLKKLHAVWLLKIKDSDPDFYNSIGDYGKNHLLKNAVVDTEWNDLKKAKNLKKNKKPNIKKVKRLISTFEIDRRSSFDKENLNVVGKKLKKSLKRKPILIKNKITKSKIGLSMPLLDDENDVSHTLKHLGHGTLTTKNTGSTSFIREASKCNIKNDKLALNVEEHLGNTEYMNSLHLGASNILKINALSPKYDFLKEEVCKINKDDIKNNDVVLELRSNVEFQKKLFTPTYDIKNNLCLVKTTGLDHLQLVNIKEDDEQTIIVNKNLDYSIDDNSDHCNVDFDEYEKQSPSIKVVNVSDDDIEINQHLPILPLKRKHSIKACGRNHRQADIKEHTWERNSRNYRAIYAGKFLHSGFDYGKLNEAFLDVVVFLPNRDPDQDEKRTCMIKVSSILLKDNILDLILNPLLNTVKRFTESEAAFVIQKNVDFIMEQIVIYQVDGPPSFKFRLEQTNKYIAGPSKNKLLYDEIDSDDDISDEDDLNSKFDLNAEHENCIYCCYKKITKKRNSFGIQLYNGVIKLNGKERYFNTLKGIVIFQ